MWHPLGVVPRLLYVPLREGSVIHGHGQITSGVRRRPAIDRLGLLLVAVREHESALLEQIHGGGRLVRVICLPAAADLASVAHRDDLDLVIVEHGPAAFEIAGALAALGLELPCIAVCGHEPDAGQLLEAAAAGIQEVVPVRAAARLAVAVDRALDHRRLLRRCRQAEQALAASEERFDLFMQHLPGVAFIKDEAGGYLWANELLSRASGLAPDEIRGKHDFELWPPHLAAAVVDSDRAARAQGQTVEEKGELEHEGRHWEHYTVRFPIPAPGGRVLLGGIGIDVTERCRAEQQLKEAAAALERRAEQLRALASEMTQVEQRERRRLAQLLHDHLQQLLVAAKYDVGALRRRTNDPEMLHALKQIEGLLKDSLRASRSLTIELSPPILYEAGLGAALHWLARWMDEKHGLVVDVTTDGVIVKNESVRVLLFQAARELLFNVVKHAGVRQARAKLCSEDGYARLTIEDAGAGFASEALTAGEASSGGFGLFSVRERLCVFGGRVEIASEPGQGARVTLWAPLEAVPPIEEPEPGPCARSSTAAGPAPA